MLDWTLLQNIHKELSLTLLLQHHSGPSLRLLYMVDAGTAGGLPILCQDGLKNAAHLRYTLGCTLWLGQGQRPQEGNAIMQRL